MAISLEEFHVSNYELHTAAELRLLYQLYEDALLKATPVADAKKP